MHMDIYDGFLFGNGLTMNLLNQLKTSIPSTKLYLLNIDDFLVAMIKGGLSEREKRKIFTLLYKKSSIENSKYYDELIKALSQFYQTRNANIEYHLGVDLFQNSECDYDYSLIKSVFPMVYNIWHEILIDFLNYLGLGEKIDRFYASVKGYLDNKSHVFTTNFDRFADKITPKHMHGVFVNPLRKYDDLIFKYIDENNFLFRCIWGWNGIGKLDMIRKYRSIPEFESSFNFDFFFDNEIHMKHLLLYGIGFQTAGYMNELSKAFPKYRKPSFGGVIDEHILIRLAGLQEKRQLEQVTFTYYADSELQYFCELVDLFNIKSVHFKKSTEFAFSVLE